jgi:predicted nucleic acid-binding protein
VADIFVIDCSVVAKWVLLEAHREASLRIYERYASGEIKLIAPDLLLAEFASLLSKRSRRKQMTATLAKQAFAAVTDGAPYLYETRPLLPKALALSLRYALSLWDSVYLALAIEYDCPFLTADQRLFRSGVGRHASIELLA